MRFQTPSSRNERSTVQVGVENAPGFRFSSLNQGWRNASATPELRQIMTASTSRLPIAFSFSPTDVKQLSNSLRNYR